MKNKKQTMINMIAQVSSFFVTLGINFFLTPFIVKNIGKEAYGFVGLANNFINYAVIITAALNSMASRFITISIHREDYESTNRYMTSVVLANILLSVPIAVIASFVVLFAEKIVNIPPAIVGDVKLLWGLLFLNFTIGLLANVFNVATFAKNRLELASIRQIESNMIKVIILFVAFCFFKPSVWYLGLSTLLCGLFVIATNVYYTKKLLPFVEIKKKYIDFSKIKELISSGIWNSLTKLSGVLASGLDLLIANLFVGAAAMGNVSLSKTLHAQVLSLFSAVSSVFAPQLTASYAKNDFEDMKAQLISSIKLLSFFASIPIIFIFVYSGEFFKLWIPGEDYKLLQTMAILTALALPATLAMEPLWNIFTVVNKVKQSSMCLMVTSVISVIGTFVLLNVAQQETARLYIIVGFSTAVALIRNLTFLPIAGAKCLKLKWYVFYPLFLRVFVSVAVGTVLAVSVKNFFEINDWMSLILSAGVMSVFVCFINLFILLSKKERHMISSVITGKLKRKA